MINPVKALLFLFKGKIRVGNTIIPVIKRNYPIDKTPCVTIEDTTGGRTYRTDFLQMKLPLPTSHPQFDSNDPDRLFPQQVLRMKRNITLNLNVWCNSEEERDMILTQIDLIIKWVFSNNYHHCTNFNNSTNFCETLNRECEAIQSINGRGIKNQCPNPEEYSYQNIFGKYHLLPKTFNVEPPFSLDDFNTEPPALRSVIKVTTDYYEYYRIGGNEIEDITFEGLI